MTGVIFGIILAFEMAFTIYCVSTALHHRKKRCYIRLTGFVIFVILCMTGILEWGMRWYLLGVLLLILAMRSIYILNFSQKKQKQFRKRKIILNGAGMILLFTAALFPAFLFPQYEEIKPTGEYNIAVAEYTFTSNTPDYYNDGSRQVNVAFWYPKETEGKYPLIVFSHGAFGIKNSNQSAYEELASHGYVVCAIDHPGHSFYTESQNGKVVLVDKKYMEEVIYVSEDSYYAELIQKWMKIRTEDINFTIDTILQYTKEIEKADEDPTLYELIDTEKIGMFGHSMGAAASVQIGRERKDVDAVINIDGPYFSEIVYDNNQGEFIPKKEPYDIPILNIYSDQVWVQLHDGTDTGVYAGNKISGQICKESYDVYLKGTKHLALTDLSLVSPVLTRLVDGQKSEIDARENIKLENSLILKFFDVVLKDKGKFSEETTALSPQ
ncbi:platelet-activating factor acetylhydrolase isoform II [Mobilisporobacter senegalensis]|uniref:Platelet-activating factor acetylhydrolase isoform II n=1 Tax=Mobilisporobacter senegalensis TaxID=1329262 RepID=A0A3N1XP68_9FIRM|nr:dienelactone hydrolase family protein [Mobilisporobacter senegalensis]ROR28490.1 platelet-activating factor acetylhydrolase isoform II [Mobilisporobacter senegalensis]